MCLPLPRGPIAALTCAAACAGWFGVEAEAGAESPPGGASLCAVSVTPVDAPSRWWAAARSAQERVRHFSPDAGCKAIGIEAIGDQAMIAFSTRDGRQTLRPISSPEEIGPLIDALVVTVPAEAAVPPIPVPSEDTSGDVETPADGRPGDRQDTARMVFHAAAGGRMSSPGGFASPSVDMTAAMLVGAWEVAASGRWDPSYSLLHPAPQAFTMSRCAVSAVAGRRVVAGGAAIAFGLSTGVSVTSEAGSEGRNQPAGDARAAGNSAAEPLLGTYLGLVYPRASQLRLRSELSGEVSALRVGRTLTLDAPLPPLPWWSALASVGLEWEVP